MSFAARYDASTSLLTSIGAPESRNPLLEMPQQSRSILFVDASVDDLQTLVNGAAAGTEVHVLQRGQDAIGQITQTLLGRSGIESLQIVSHGRLGGVQLGESWLDLQSLPGYVGQLKSWGEALSESADILLYGCNVGQDATGQAFINLLAQVTGADVAASEDLTGNAVLGGDWDLEVKTGQIESFSALQEESLAAYENVLASISGNIWQDVNANQVQNAGEAGFLGITVFLDQNRNYIPDAGEATAITDANGDYSFTGLAAGTYFPMVDVNNASIQWITASNTPILATGVSTISLDSSGGGTPMNVAFNPITQQYYGATGGWSSSPNFVYSLTGARLQSTSVSRDLRAWNYNPNTGQLEGITYSAQFGGEPLGFFSAELNGAGLFTGNTTTILGSMPGNKSDQTMPAYDPARDRFYSANGNNIINIVDRSNGASQETITLDFATAGISGMNNAAIGYDPVSNYLIVAPSGTPRAAIFDLGGNFIGSSTLPSVSTFFGMGFTNRQFFTNSSGSAWQGYSIFTDNQPVTVTANQNLTGIGFGVLPNNTPPVLTLNAIDTAATEAVGDLGTYRISRDQTGGPQTIGINISGTATADDYNFSLDAASISAGATISVIGSVLTLTLPNGVLTADLVVTPTDDIQAEAAETVQLELAPGSYTIGTPNTDTVTIAQNDFVVTNTNDSGEGSLRQAILNANVLAGTDTITFGDSTFTDAIADTITITSGQLDISSDLTLTGTGANLLTISGNNASRIFAITSGTVNLSGMTIANGSSDVGGGIYNVGALNLSNSTLSGNSASNGGGGIFSYGTVSLSNSTLSGNSAGNGGGIYTTNTLSLSNSTLSGNSAIGIAGGIYSDPSATVSLSNNTLIGNSASNGGGIYNDGTIAIATNNLFVDSNVSGFIPNATNLVGTATALGLDPILRDNGGPTQTHALLPGSSAINAATSGIATDQRSIAAVSARDIGAFESRDFTINTTGGTPQNTLSGSAFGNPLAVTVSSASGDPVAGGTVTYTVPGSDASATLSSATVILNVSGVASVTATANNTPGTYTVSAGGNGITTPASFNLTNDNNAPTDLELSSTSIDENAIAGIVGDITVTDPDTQTAFLSNVVTVDDARFEVVNNSGTLQLKLKAGASLNFETTPSVTINLTVTNGSLTYAEQFILTVNNINEAPTALSLANVVSTIAENTNTTAGFKVADISITDDAIGSNTFSLTGANATSFEIRDVAGAKALYFIGNSPNFELSQTSYSVTVEAVDSSLAGTTPVTQSLTLNVSNANDPLQASIALSGQPFLGNTISTNESFSDEDGVNSVTYQWQQSTDGNTWNDIDNATNNSFIPNGNQLNQRVRVLMSVKDNLQNTETVTSLPSAPIVGIAPPSQTLSNISTTSGQTVTQWLADLTTSSYPPGYSYVVNVDRSEFFEVLPSVAPNGTLTYSLKPGLKLNQPITLTVQLKQPDGTINPASTRTSQLSLTYKPEALTRDSATGEVSLLYIDQVTQLQSARSLVNPNGQKAILNSSWEISDAEDVNRDGVADVLLYNREGDEVKMWTMAGNGQIRSDQSLVDASGQILRTGNANWQVIGMADIDGDNFLDMIWHNQKSDEVGFWFMQADGVTVKSYDYLRDANGAIFKTNNPNWKLTGFADFDGDGDIDLLFRLPELNQTAIVQLQGKAVVSAQFITPNANPNLVFRGVGDADGDRIADIYWQTSDNAQVLIQILKFQAGQWQSDEFKTIAQSGNLQLQGIGDLDRNNTADLLWRDSSSNSLLVKVVESPTPAMNLLQQGQLFQFNTPNQQIAQIAEFGELNSPI